MKNIINDSLRGAFSYRGYREKIASLLSQGKASGSTQTEALVNYTLLNETRMNRLEKTISITEEDRLTLASLKGEYIWLVISEGWCGDSAQLVPLFNKMAEVSENIDLKIVFRDDNNDLMDLFLTNGARSIPLLVILEKESLKVVGRWGARPKGAADLIKRYKAEFGLVDEKAKTELQLWYLHDKGISTVAEITELMSIADRA